MKLLTLALPVYNGEACISLTLESIIRAQNKVLDKDKILFEIIISDNCSSDKTEKIVQEYQSNNFECHYFKNETNVGYDGNIDLLVSRAKAKYIWFLGCGERVKEDALIRLIEKLSNDEDYTNILVDFDIYDETKDMITDKKIFNFQYDILLSSKNDFSYDKYGPAVSSNIINRKKWLEVSKKLFVVDGWSHIERILDMIALDDEARTLLLPQPYFTLYREAKGWWTKPNSYLLLLLLLHIDVIKSMITKGYNENVVKRLIKKQSRIGLLIAIVQSKENGLKTDIKLIREMFKRFKYDYFFWTVAFPLLLLPKFMMVVPRILFSLLKKIKSLLQ